MAAINEHTGKAIKTKSTTDAYRDNWDRIFGKKEFESEPWYVAEYNVGVDPQKIFDKALNQNDMQAQEWILEAQD